VKEIDPNLSTNMRNHICPGFLVIITMATRDTVKSTSSTESWGEEVYLGLWSGEGMEVQAYRFDRARTAASSVRHLSAVE
jgi:hypothetical protein